MLKGMLTTIRHVFRPTFNAGYPGVPRVLPGRSRSSFELPVGDDGTPLCKSCLLCERNCPDAAIRITSSKREDGPGRILERFEIDLGLCMYCGICVETCPSSGLRHTGLFEHATPERSDTLLVLFSRDTVATGSPEPAKEASE
jgi:NADH-quinone oxidoreductase subunit I